jgi:hypothetical protein
MTMIDKEFLAEVNTVERGIACLANLLHEESKVNDRIQAAMEFVATNSRAASGVSAQISRNLALAVQDEDAAWMLNELQQRAVELGDEADIAHARLAELRSELCQVSGRRLQMEIHLDRMRIAAAG